MTPVYSSQAPNLPKWPDPATSTARTPAGRYPTRPLSQGICLSFGAEIELFFGKLYHFMWHTSPGCLNLALAAEMIVGSARGALARQRRTRGAAGRMRHERYRNAEHSDRP